MAKRSFGGGILGQSVLVFLFAMSVIHPFQARRLVEDAVQLWWTHLVPVLFAGLLGAAWFARATPRPLVWAPLWSLASLPLVGGIVLLDAYRHRAITKPELERGLLWANLYNPLLVPAPATLALFDLCLVTGALVLSRLPAASPTKEHNRPKTGLACGFNRRAILDAMNWTTVVGAGVVAAFWLQLVFPYPALTAWFLDPISWHWRAPTVPWWALVPIGLNGTVFLLPLALYRRRLGLDGKRWLLYRLAQALFAALLYGALF